MIRNEQLKVKVLELKVHSQNHENEEKVRITELILHPDDGEE